MDSANILPGQRKVSPEQAFRLALEHHAAGRRQQAETLVRKVVQLQPRHAHAWQLLAIITHEAGDTAQAIELMGKAIQASPMVSGFYSNRAEMHRLAGNPDQALADGEQAVRLAPESAIAHCNLGIIRYHRLDLDGAEASQQRALQLAPDHLPAINNMGSIRRDRKDRAGAVEMYRRVLALRPDYHEAANNLGAVLTEMEDPEGGLKVLLEVVRKRPNYAEAHCNLGHAFLALENYAQAEQAMANALRLKPDYAEAMEGLARCAQEARDYARAEQYAMQAHTLKPQRPHILTLMAGIQSEQGYQEKALVTYDRALALDPNMIGALIGKGHALMELGRLDQAEQQFRRAIELDPQALASRQALTQVRKVSDDDDNFAALRKAAENIASMPETRAMSLHFSLGKAYDDTKQYDLAFPHFLEGCRIKRTRTEYDADRNTRTVENICRVFSRERIDSLRGAGHPSSLPIFVLGMPRSGTTLTETIIASHPQVFGAGELPDLLHIAAAHGGTGNPGYPLNMQRLTRDDLEKLGREYADRLQTRAPGYRHITDKMPANFMGLGLAHLILPNAKIVHVRRNAVDTCLSGFTKLFSRSQRHTYDLRELGRYYRDYLTVTNHWRTVLPPGSFYEVRYEQLVANQEEESRKLIAYCGLEWDDACLSPDKTERTVKTASITQVRQPVYQSSVERWRVYEKFLGPLLEELGDAAYE